MARSAIPTDAETPDRASSSGRNGNESGRARLEARLPAHVKDLIEYAANLEGRSLSDFVVESARSAAMASIERHQVIHLTLEESKRLVELLLDPPVPNEALRRAKASHARLIEMR